ncbi:contractile injection system tape measure protein, partial [Yoonia sp.]|uniref:contractile injection system tape measure protein n=1 Tax=Yoonia sp. TaxID=2212373 RepID=UPI0025D306F9
APETTLSSPAPTPSAKPTQIPDMTPKSPDTIFNDPDQSQNPDVAQTKPTSDQPADPTAPETTLSSPAPTPSAKPRNDPTRSRQTDSAMSRADHAKPTRIPDIAGQPTDPSTPDKALPPATSTARTQDAATSQPRRSEIAETVQENDAPTLPTSDVAAHRTGADAKTAPTQAGPQPPNASPDSPRLPATARAAPSTDRLQDVPLVDAPSDDDRALAEQRMQALFAKVTGDTYSTVAPMLDLVWSVLGTGPHVNATDRAQFWALAVGAAAQTTPTAEDQDHIIATFVMAVLPRPDHRIGALRAAIARLGYATGGIAPGLRHQARATLTKVLDQLNTPPAAPTKTTTKAPVARATATRVMTAQSGLVLFHPYIAMLFTRMEIARDARGIAHQDMGRAAAALWWLAMGAGAPPKPADPLVNCLLGLAFHTPAPPVVTLDTDTRSLIDGLIQSVIAQWARLGGTSADGLRAAFVQRAGVLRQDEAATILTVTPGPYDMLLDSLPWSINMIGLPWMPTPLSVKWRGSDD